jgi:DNA-binding CsgD family transcriptional regulator
MLVGRESEIATINRFLAEARLGRAAGLVVAGEAGIGKTALLEDSVARAPDFLVLRTRGVEAEAEVPFAALIELLGPMASKVDGLPEPQARALRGVFALAGLQQLEATAAAAATLALLAATAEEAPLLVLVDDAHWLDVASGFAAAFAARRLREARIAILFGVRDEEEPRFSLEGIERLALKPLKPDAALELVTSASRSLDEATAQRIVASGAGNPLALLELPSLVRAGGDVSVLSEPLPPGEAARRLFGRRLSALERAARLSLLVAAAERSGELRVLTPAWSSLDVATHAIEAAEDCGLVRIDEQRLEFRHPLVRSLAYGDATPAERRRAHEALAAALADDPRARDERTWHLALAAVGPDAEVADALSESAARLPTPAATLERAARLTPHRAVRARRLIEAAEAAQTAGEYQAAASLAVEGQQQGDDVFDHARAEHVIALSEFERDRPRDAVDRLARAAASIAEVAPAQAARMLADTIDPCASSGQMERGVELATRARELARGSDSLTRLRVALRHADATFWSGRFGAARRLALAAAEEAERHDGTALESIEARVLLHEAFCAGGDFGRARRPVEQAVSEARRAGALGLLQWALAGLFTVEFFAGRVRRALAAAEEELELAEGLARRFTRIEALGHVAWCEAMRGLEERCRAHISERFELSASGRADPIVHPALGLLELALGHGEAAVAALEPTVRIREQRGAVDAAMWTPELPLLIEAYARADRFADADATLAHFETQARKVERPLAEALAHRCRGMLNDEGFEAEFDAALAAHDLDPRPFERARTLLCYGERLRREKRRLDARERIREARDAFVGFGATAWAKRAEAELAATGERSRRRIDATRDDLTPREFTVARLVAQGLTNKEVAAQLFLSTNTIETHLRHVFQKLGVRSRTELVAKLTDFGDSTTAPEP